MVHKFSDMGRYAIEPDNATKSAKAKVQYLRTLLEILGGAMKTTFSKEVVEMFEEMWCHMILIL